MTAFDRDVLVRAFDRLGEAALEAGARLEIAVYRGAALMLASNFRWSSEDVDIASIGPWPDWLTVAVAEIADALNLSPDWLNDAVDVHLSRLAERAGDHHAFASFPRDGEDVGLAVYVPTAEYMLALKLKAMRVLDPAKGAVERTDIVNLMHVVGIDGVEEAVGLLSRYFPRSGADADKQRFLLRHVLATTDEEMVDAPRYLV